MRGPGEGGRALAARLEAIEARITAACDRAGRKREEVTLVAVSKTFPAEVVRAAHALGLRDFGENYAQELRDKARALSDLEDLRWHFVGPVQSNKARYLVGTAERIHALDSEGAAEALSARALRTGAAPLAVLLAVNLGREPQKRGLAPEAVPAFAQRVARLPGLTLTGLMTLPPKASDPEASRPYFRALRQLRDRLVQLPGLGPLTELSMGMSSDFEVAIEEGATHLRVGTALFGARPVKGAGEAAPSS
ncbi:MAG: YggS family pyridoxal phosphate-dependent enzyme [Deltaproteobacteria bacterium]|nr:MAG: YggS family pyridoxal phosphate-dependent enzyme [Deltaproteobacteria bacterium]